MSSLLLAEFKCRLQKHQRSSFDQGSVFGLFHEDLEPPGQQGEEWGAWEE